MPEAVRRQNNKRPMKKSFSLAAIFMAMAFVANVQTAYADRQGFNPEEPACALPAENLLDAANDNFNFKSFGFSRQSILMDNTQPSMCI